MNHQLSRAIIGAGAGIGAGIALQPLYAEPTLHQLAVQSGELLLRAGGSISVVLAAAYAIHRIKSWATERPVMPTPSAMYAALATMPPQLQQTAAIAQSDARRETDAEHQTYHAVVTFCIIGESRQTFAYRDLRGCVDRPTWDFLTRYLSKQGVLRVGHGQTPTWFAEGWTSARVRVALRRNEIALPQKAGDDPIIVRWNSYRHKDHAHEHRNTLSH